jgi:hypothetical protein
MLQRRTLGHCSEATQLSTFPIFFATGPLLIPLTFGHGIDQDFEVAIDTPIINKMLLKHTFEHQQKITPP